MAVGKWIYNNINENNFKNKNIFITGGNSGIGFELAKHCAKLGSNIYLLCRNENKAYDAIAEIKQNYPQSNINFIKLDLADLYSVESAAKEVQKYDVDFFINNAGVFRLPHSKTKNDFEITMGTNFLGPLYLSSLLLPYFSSLNHDVHVVFETSITSRYSKIDYNDFFMDKNYSTMKIYGRSKIAVNNMYRFFAEQYVNTNLIFSLTHPGGTYTPLITKGYRFKPLQIAAKGFMKLVFHSPEKASLTMLMGMNESQNSIIGPRGLLEVSGYPKKTKFKIDVNYKLCVETGLKYVGYNIGESL